MARAKENEERFASRTKRYTKGTTLFREGDESDDNVYVIHRGRIRLTKRIHHNDIYLETLGPGEFCGELALLMRSKRPVTATVVEDCESLVISGKQFEDMLANNPSISLRMLKKLVARLTKSQFRQANFSLRRNAARLLHQLKWEVRIAQAEKDAEPMTAQIPTDLHEVLFIERAEVHRLLKQLRNDGLITVENGLFRIMDPTAFDRYLAFLELKDRFDYLD